MLTVDNLDVFYGDAQALDGVSLEVAAGSIVAIVGANGAGKTSLIRTIAGMQAPARGRIRFRDQEIAGLPSYRVCDLGIGQVAEARQIFPTLSVAENLSMGAMIPRAQTSREQNLERVYALFPRLTERRSQAAGTLSGGEQQMLSMSRALATKPALLLLDELSMGLAPLIVEELYERVADLAREGISILNVEQFAQAILGVSTDASIMLHGRITRTGPPQELAEELAAAYLGASA